MFPVAQMRKWESKIETLNPDPEAQLDMWGGHSGCQDAREQQTNKSCTLVFLIGQKCVKGPLWLQERLRIWTFHFPAFKLEEDKGNGYWGDQILWGTLV